MMYVIVITVRVSQQAEIITALNLGPAQTVAVSVLKTLCDVA